MGLPARNSAPGDAGAFPEAAQTVGRREEE